MSAFADAVDDYLRAMERAQTAEDVAAAVPPLQAHVYSASPEELTEQLKRLHETIQETSLAMAATTSLVCGAMVENGGDPEVCGPFLLDHLGKLLGELREYWDQVRAHSGATLTHDNAMQLGETYYGTISQTHPNPAWAFYFHRPYTMGMIAHLSKSKKLRATARSRPQLLADAPNVDMATPDDETYLSCMLRVLDDERLIILHPAEQKGFEVCITAVADVVQLDTLLAANLCGPT